jgi:type III secretion system low calcium response chaperone LcrH/SycD
MNKQANVHETHEVVTAEGSAAASDAPEKNGKPVKVQMDVHSYVYDFFGRGMIDQAETLFRFLCIYDFHNPDYLMGLAAVFQLKKQYVKAHEIYMIAFSLDESDFRPLFHAGHCYLALQEISLAHQCFERVRENSPDSALRALASATLQSMPLKPLSPPCAQVDAD